MDRVRDCCKSGQVGNVLSKQIPGIPLYVFRAATGYTANGQITTVLSSLSALAVTQPMFEPVVVRDLAGSEGLFSMPSTTDVVEIYLQRLRPAANFACIPNAVYYASSTQLSVMPSAAQVVSNYSTCP